MSESSSGFRTRLRPPALNHRQRAYLWAIYAEELVQRREPAPELGNPSSADESHWQVYLTGYETPSPLARHLLEQGLVDQGTGATLAALETKGLLSRKHATDAASLGLPPRPGAPLLIRLTPRGREMARQLAQEMAALDPTVSGGHGPSEQTLPELHS